MAGSARSSEALTLQQVADLLGLGPRQVQYLRESGAVVPSVVGEGTGRACLYTQNDVERVYLALVCLVGFSYEAKRDIVDAVFSSDQVRCVIDINPVVRIEVSRERIRSKVAQLFS